MAQATFLERFEAKYDSCPTTGCWLWTAALFQRTGYGAIQRDGGVRRAHRVAWELYVGPIPEGLWVLHRCDTPACVNPNHLFLGTALDNNHDMIRKGRQITVPRPLQSHCQRGHLFEGHNVRMHNDGARRCRACAREKDRLRKARYRAIVRRDA